MIVYVRRDRSIHRTVIGICPHLILLGTALVASAGTDPFPGDIVELRPPHVRVSEPGETEAQPRSGQYFSFFEPPPAIAPQQEVRLTEHDLLTLVYPAERGRYSSGGYILRDRLRIEGRELVLDIFDIPISFFGDALVPPSENAIFVGQLAAGEYDVAIRNWYLPPTVLPWLDPGTPIEFDPEAFEPPKNVIIYVPPPVPPSGVYATFSRPLLPGEPPVVVPSSFQFTVIAIPEPSSLASLTVLILCAAGIRRVGARRGL